MITFHVPGLPRPKGSTVAFRHSKTGRIVTRASNADRLEPWEAVVRLAAKGAIREPLTGPVCVEVEFELPRPQGHYRSGKRAGEVRDSAPPLPTTKPDLDKLLRACLDALTGVAWGDDAQVVQAWCRKVYALPRGPGATVRVGPADEPEP